MKFITVLILLSLISINSFIYFGYYDARLLNSKEAAARAITKSVNKNNFLLIKIPLSQKEKFSQLEIWYQHNLYDVATREFVHDSIYIYLYHDNDEENVLTEIADFFQPDACDYFALFPGAPVLKSVHYFPDTQYLYLKEWLLSSCKISFKKSLTHKEFTLPHTVFEVNTPPPRV